MREGKRDSIATGIARELIKRSEGLLDTATTFFTRPPPWVFGMLSKLTSDSYVYYEISFITGYDRLDPSSQSGTGWSKLLESLDGYMSFP